jgi:hypothetical protein
LLRKNEELKVKGEELRYAVLLRKNEELRVKGEELWYAFLSKSFY